MQQRHIGLQSIFEKQHSSVEFGFYARTHQANDGEQSSQLCSRSICIVRTSLCWTNRGSLSSAISAETGDPVRFEPEVADRSRGSAFPHQTDADRQANLASSTQGEAPVKTREYTPTSDDKKIYPEES